MTCFLKKYLACRPTVFFSLLFFLCFHYSYSQDRTIDSIKKILVATKEDTGRVITMLNLSRQYWITGNNAAALKYGKQSLSTLNMLISEASASDEKMQRKLKTLRASCYNSIGIFYSSQSNFPEALKHYLESLKLSEELKDTERMLSAYNNIGSFYSYQGDIEKALSYFFKCRDLYLGQKDSVKAIDTYNNIGVMYMSQNNYDSALYYFETYMALKEKQKDVAALALVYNNVGSIYNVRKEYARAIEYLRKSLKLSESINDSQDMQNANWSLGSVYRQQKKYKESEMYFKQGLNLALKSGNKLNISSAYAALAVLDSSRGDFASAFNNYKLFHVYTDSVFNEGTKEQNMREEMNYEFEKKESEANAEQEKKDAVVAAEKKKERVILFSVTGLLVLVFAFFVFAFRSYLQKQKANRELDEKNKAISQQKLAIEEKNMLITDSIEYAKSIQESILPGSEWMKKIFPESFIFFRPKDVVSGDFYWMKVHENPEATTVLLATVDCTGHGVPGAFMSIMAFNMLENITNDKNLLQPSLILDELNKEVTVKLAESIESSSAKFGMDVSLIALPVPLKNAAGDQGSRTIRFSGAHNSFYIIRNGELFETKADKSTIGLAKESFTNHSIEVKTGDMLYLFTDGYADQLGGPQRKKFFTSNFRELLLSIAGESADVQLQKIAENFDAWKNETEQIDDVLVLGIRV